MKLNIGCGKEYIPEWINVDGNNSVKADVYCDLLGALPFQSDSVDSVLLSHVLEHIPQEKLWSFLDEIYRVCKNGAVIHIFVPHFTSIHAFGPTHYTAWHINSMNTFDDECKYNYSIEKYCNFRCKVIKANLHFLMTRGKGLSNKYKIYKLSPDWLWNFNRVVQMFFERFWPFRFDEISWKIRVVK